MSERVSSWVLGVLALLLTVPAVVGIARVDQGLTRTTAEVGSVPVVVLTGDPSQPRPVVVVAHGFAGSAQLMDDLGVALAGSGYAVVLLDFSGHGRNATPLPVTGRDVSTGVLDRELGDVVAWTREQPWADPARLGLLGHSMGAGAVVRYAVADATGPRQVMATVAVSLPSDSAVTTSDPAVPRDLLLVVGGNELPQFTDAALGALRAAYPSGEAGPGYGSPVDGTARAVHVVPRADHVSILFSSDTAQAAVDWFDESVGAPSSGHTVGGGRIGWLLLLTLGAAIGFVPLARLAFGPVREASPAPAWWLVALVGLGSAVVASLVARALPSVAERVPLAVGGHVVLWFAVAGLTSYGVTKALRVARVAPVDVVAGFPWRDLVATFAMTAYAVLALGLVAQRTWTAFSFAGGRERWLLLVELALLAWFWADDRIVGRRWWLALVTRAIAVVVLLASVVLLGAPGFLTLLVPLMGVVLLLLLVYGQTVTRRSSLPWAAALVQAIPLAYLVTTTFPLVS
ncbi:MAG: alpha/beta fold hydrolase [Candidatus Nanopelagicales bacterium]